MNKIKVNKNNVLSIGDLPYALPKLKKGELFYLVNRTKKVLVGCFEVGDCPEKIVYETTYLKEKSNDNKYYK